MDLHAALHKDRPCLGAKSSLLQIRDFFIDDVQCFPIFIIRLEKRHRRLYEILGGSTGVRRLPQLNDSSQHKTFWERVVARKGQHFIELRRDLAPWCGSLWDSLALKFWNNWQPDNLTWPSGVCTGERKSLLPLSHILSSLGMAQSAKMPVWEGEELSRKEFSTDLPKASQVTTPSTTMIIVFYLTSPPSSQQHGNNYGEEKPGQDHLSSTRGLYFLDTFTVAINKSCLTLSHSLLHSCVTLLCAFSQLSFLARLLAQLQII